MFEDNVRDYTTKVKLSNIFESHKVVDTFSALLNHI